MKELIDAAMGRIRCDLTVTNVKIFNVFTGETEEGSVGVKNGTIVGIGDYEGERTYDGGGRYLLPAFTDAHIHVESSMLSPEAFALLAVPHGTGCIVADPHEIVNVTGVAGAEYVKEAFSRVRKDGKEVMDVLLQLPSCVPATPFETSGAALTGKETEAELARGVYSGLGEMMNFPAVLSCDGDALKKLAAARELGLPVDGHAPALAGKQLNAYLCGGVMTDHECLTAAEFSEKAARGMYVQIRVGSSTDSVEEGVKAVTPFNYKRFLLCSDDRHADDLARGHVDGMLARLVKAGLPAKFAIPMATINPAECYHVRGVGAIAPDYKADMVLVNDLVDFSVYSVWKGGVLVAEQGKPLFGTAERYLPEAVKNTVRVKEVGAEDFRIISHGGRLRAIEMTPRTLYTEEVFWDAPAGKVQVKGTDYLKLAVAERHFRSGNIGLGLVKGYGLKGGAIGITVSHDSHNLIVLGDDDGAMARVVSLLAEAGGGMAAVDDGGADVFPLDIAGLMSSASADEVVAGIARMNARAKAMGVKDGYDPFMSLAFLALPVIPKLKLTDRGLVDLGQGGFVPLEELKNR